MKMHYGIGEKLVEIQLVYFKFEIPVKEAKAEGKVSKKQMQSSVIGNGIKNRF